MFLSVIRNFPRKGTFFLRAAGGAIRESSRRCPSRVSPCFASRNSIARNLYPFPVLRAGPSTNSEYTFRASVVTDSLELGRYSYIFLSTVCTVRLLELVGVRVGGSLSPPWSSLRGTRPQWQIWFAICEHVFLDMSIGQGNARRGRGRLSPRR